MRQTRAIELGTGLFVLLGFAALLFLVDPDHEPRVRPRRQRLPAARQFEHVGGLKPGAPVSMAGVTIGRVEAIDLRLQANTRRGSRCASTPYDRYPDDSDASILTAGLLGGQYIGIGPGGSETYLKDGDQMQFTQSAIVLENLISKYLFSKAAERQRRGGASEGSRRHDATCSRCSSWHCSRRSLLMRRGASPSRRTPCRDPGPRS